MDDEIALPKLIGWYERNVERTPTLALIRAIVQGAFPLLPTSRVLSLGREWELIEAVRADFGDPEFGFFVQCQVEGYRRERSSSGEGFYLAYLVSDQAQRHYDTFRERLSYNGFYSVRSETFRKCYPVECDWLREYFRRMMMEEAEPDWAAVRRGFILTGAPPVWVYYAVSREEAREAGEAGERAWVSGKTRVLAKRLKGDRAEYGRAAVEALYYTALAVSPSAWTFTVVPGAAAEFPLPYQIGFQFRSRKNEFMTDA